MFKRFLKDEDGQGVVEYGLIIGLIAIIIVAIFIALGPEIKKLFTGPVTERPHEERKDVGNAT